MTIKTELGEAGEGAIVFAAGYALGFCHATMASIRINSRGREQRNG